MQPTKLIIPAAVLHSTVLKVCSMVQVSNLKMVYKCSLALISKSVNANMHLKSLRKLDHFNERTPTVLKVYLFFPRPSERFNILSPPIFPLSWDDPPSTAGEPPFGMMINPSPPKMGGTSWPTNFQGRGFHRKPNEPLPSMGLVYLPTFG